MSQRIGISDTSAIDFLWQRINYERTSQIPYASGDFKLERMRELLRRLNNPQQNVPVVHVAGTKGKGSTSAMIAAILQSAGYRTGLYTSPHLEHLEERYQIQGAMIPTQQLELLLQEIRPVVEEMDNELANLAFRGPTFFEITTALAFLHFQRQQVELAVLEVGLGGRLDSTNVCQPEVCAITSISFDHTKQLGNTLAAIAREKAGIIKRSIPIISGVTNAEPRDVIRAVAQQIGAPLFQSEVDYNIRPISKTSQDISRFDYILAASPETGTMHDLCVHLRGEHQLANAGVAVSAVLQLRERGWNINEAAIRAGLASATCPGRIEVIRLDPPVILDTAHNLASIEALCRELEAMAFPGRSVLVFATSKDKDVAGMLEQLLPRFDEVVLTRYIKNPRAVPVEELVALANKLGKMHDHDRAATQIHAAETPDAAWRKARELGDEQSLLCVAGSFFLAAELRPRLLAEFATKSPQ